MTTKVLVSPGYGAGWATWNLKPKEVAEYAPIIEYIENGGDPSKLNVKHELVKKMILELELPSFYCGGAGDLCVEVVDGPYRINEHDGNECIQTSADFW
jgi:hypothetical protein